MKDKHIKYIVITLLVLLALVPFILWLIASNRKKSIIKEIEKKERQLEIIFSDLTVAKAQKACLDRAAEYKMKMLTYVFLGLGLAFSLFCGFYHQESFVSFYLVFKSAINYITLMLGLSIFKKMLSKSAIMDRVEDYLRKREYRLNNFDSTRIDFMIKRSGIIEKEIHELKKQVLAV